MPANASSIRDQLVQLNAFLSQCLYGEKTTARLHVFCQIGHRVPFVFTVKWCMHEG